MAENNIKKEVVTGSATYEGETCNGMKHGMGTLTWDDGDQYVGLFEFDEKKNGTFRWKAGDTYTGEWQNSLMHGYGTYTYKNGRIYEGQWVGGYKQGYGIFTWPNNDRYEGEFFKDECHGVGIQTYADKRVYKGEWKANKKHGCGMLILPNGDSIRGEWTNNLFNGVAIFTEANGDRYKEYYRDGLPEGARVPLKRKGQEIEKLLTSSVPPEWIPDNEQKQCYSCDSTFGLVNRRHHCRHCGYVFCGNCTQNKIAIHRLNLNDLCRVCEECYISIVTTIDVKKPKEFNSNFNNNNN
eukprot:TRINITY_DN2309_c0_g1_i1.p1 TRINITY_DN2309_c0_g1~~TRINITY_DN2309_c0_g1_i1.p1  ORF type:complete len:296 (-),score=88.46 TRINITY_DN2309_c0_g1_i1:96-983(-)